MHSFKSAKLHSLQRWTKIVVVNLLVLLSLLIVAEIALRLIWTVRSCIELECDLSRITSLKIHDGGRATYIGISRLDELLGYVPREGFSATINAPGWINVKVTIRKDGFRSNGSEVVPPFTDVLAVGDSFTFGDQVSDNETWPACLERKLGRGVDNGGVFGYGAAQALRRASLKLADKNYSTLVLSILVGIDFIRDRLSYRFGFPKPALIHTENGITWSTVPDPNVPGTKYNPVHKFPSFAYERSEMAAEIFDLLFPGYNYKNEILGGDRLTTVHSNSANENEIVEWTLRTFSSFKMKNKMLLLQYLGPDTNETNVVRERNLIWRIANELSLKVVDTSTVLRNSDEGKLWYTIGDHHHTPLGNEIVCSYLFEQGFQ